MTLFGRFGVFSALLGIFFSVSPAFFEFILVALGLFGVFFMKPERLGDSARTKYAVRDEEGPTGPRRKVGLGKMARKIKFSFNSET